MMILALAPFVFAACSSGSDSASGEAGGGASEFPALPTSDAERVLVDGNMSNWFYEGDAGCYGTLSRGASSIELWINADACGEREYSEGASASVVVTYRETEQWMPGKKMYTIVEFK